MSRFIVGQDYVFIRTLFERGKDSFSSKYMPWNDKLLAIEVVKLTCVSEHDVAWDQDPKEEKKYKGYVFIDDSCNKWYNQYPTACYGQLDDSSDRVVRQHFEDSKLLKYNDKGEPLKDENNSYIRAEGSEKNWEIFDSQFWNPFTLAESEIGSMYRAINPIRSTSFDLEPKDKILLQNHMNDVINKVECVSRKKIEFKPAIIKFNDGRPDKESTFVKAVLV